MNDTQIFLSLLLLFSFFLSFLSGPLPPPPSPPFFLLLLWLCHYIHITSSRANMLCYPNKVLWLLEHHPPQFIPYEVSSPSLKHSGVYEHRQGIFHSAPHKFSMTREKGRSVIQKRTISSIKKLVFSSHTHSLHHEYVSVFPADSIPRMTVRSEPSPTRPNKKTFHIHIPKGPKKRESPISFHPYP